MKYTRLIGKSTRRSSGSSMLEGNSLLLQGGYIRMLGQGAGFFSSSRDAGHRKAEEPDCRRDAFSGRGGVSGSSGESPFLSGSGADGVLFMIILLSVLLTVRGGKLVLAPTHEEAAVELAKSVVNSYKDFPLFIYQFQTKFRDEARTRAELIRAKEFIMKDAYSFHRSYSELNNFFPRVFNSYLKIFEKCNIPVLPAESGVGMMGGSKAYEFLYPHSLGKDVIILCPHCGYRANQSVAVGIKSSVRGDPERIGKGSCRRYQKPG